MSEILHIYTRVSTASQFEDGTSLKTQKEEGVKRSKKLKMRYRVWNEGGKSSSNDDLSNRPQLTQLLKLIDEGKVKHLYVWNTDRLSRNMSTWGFIRLKLISSDVHLHTPTGEMILSDPSTNLMLGVLSEVSQYDNQIRTERFRLGKIERIRNGGWKGGPPPYGYDLEDSKLIVNEEESKWVNFIFKAYSDGRSIDEIRTELLNNGVITRRKKPIWSHGSLEALLRNTHYDGYWTYKDKKMDEPITVHCPRIVAPDLFQKVVQTRSQRSYKRGGRRTKTSVVKHFYLLTGLLECGNCGKFMSGNLKQKQTSYYRCTTKDSRYKNKHKSHSATCDGQRNLRIGSTDELVWNTVVDVVSNSHLFKEAVKEKVYVSAKSSNKQEVKKLQSKLRKTEGDIKNIDESINIQLTQKILNPLLGERLENVIESLKVLLDQKKSERDELRTELRTLMDQDRWIDWVGTFGKRISQLRKKELSEEEQKEFLRGVVKKVVVTNTDTQSHKVEIHFNQPFVGDKLVWKDPEKKSKGYRLVDGNESMILSDVCLKKTIH